MRIVLVVAMVLTSAVLASTPAPSSAHNTLEGLYVGFRAGYATYLSVAPTTLDRALVYFYPEGLFITVDPDRGPPGQDSRTEFPRAHPNSKGHYSIDDQGSVLLSYEGGDRKLVTINRNGQQPGMERFIRLCTCDNLRFSGTFRMNDRLISFAPDGHFVDRGVMFGLLEARVPPPALRAPGPGVYRIVRNRLILQYQDGHSLATFFSAPDAQSASPPWILLGPSMLDSVGR
jgi:hypothetical protein